MKIGLIGNTTTLNPKQAQALFNKAESNIKAIGLDVFNPTKIGEAPQNQKFWKLSTSIGGLMKCDFIILLPGWVDCHEAKNLWATALKAGIPVFEETPKVYKHLEHEAFYNKLHPHPEKLIYCTIDEMKEEYERHIGY